MPDYPTLTMPKIVFYADPNYPERKYQELKNLLDKGQRNQVINELRILYPKDSYLTHLLANRLGIDLEKELGFIYYQDSNSITTAQITQDNTIEITTQYDNFHDILQVIQNATQYKGTLSDTLMVGISGVFGAIDKGLEKLIENTQDKRLKIAKYIFQGEGISISAIYGYGNNDGDMVKTIISVGGEFIISMVIGKVIVASLSLVSIPAFIIAGAISALIAGILMNTQAGKWAVNAITENLVKPLIESIESLINSIKSKLQSFFSLFDSNPSNYELVSNPSLESNDYKSLIELLLDSNSTAKDIDSLLHSFPHYLKKESKQEVYTPLSPQGISFPYSSIIYLTTIKALKDTLKEYLPKAKKIVLYTPNPFVSLYTSSPSYVFNSNLSFFNPHLQYLLTSKDTQQWLYDTLFNLARDNREIIVYEWGGSIEDLQEKEELDSKESQANKKDLDSKDTNQSTNIQKQTKQLGKESNKELKENQKGLESKNFYSKIQSFLCYDSKKRYA